MDPSLSLFFTRGVSLGTWDTVGMIDREIAVYRGLRSHLRDLAFITYGDAGDLSYADRLPGVRILCNRWNLPLRLYEILLPFLYASFVRSTTILKTNQTNGSLVALRASRLYSKPLLARCGYIWSEFAARQSGNNSMAAKRARRTERKVFRSADKVTVTTLEMKRFVGDNYNLIPERIEVVPNYVDTNLFRPSGRGDSKIKNTICFVGRLDKQKNLYALFDALKGLDVELTVIGNGPLRNDLVSKAEDGSLRVQFLGNVPHSNLPEHLVRAEIFILPSLYEGHPKALLEAMACGAPVIGANVPGIRELIQHGQTGYLCGTSSSEIRAAVQVLCGDSTMQARLGRNAREFVTETCSLPRVLDMELAILRSLGDGK